LCNVLAFKYVVNIADTAYEYVLGDLYGTDVLEKARAMCEGKDVFAGFKSINMNLDGFKGHKSTLEKYMSLQELKGTK